MTKFKITGTEYNASEDADPSDHGEFDYEFEIVDNTFDQKVFQLFGGPTGYESFVMHEATVTAMKEHGWRACTGTPGSYNRLSFTAKQMKAAFEQVDAIPEPPTRGFFISYLSSHPTHPARHPALRPSTHSRPHQPIWPFCFQPRSIHFPLFLWIPTGQIQMTTRRIKGTRSC